MTILGLCRHKLAIDTRCGITVIDTPYGPGHASRPKSAHYPITASGPVARFGRGRRGPIQIDIPGPSGVAAFCARWGPVNETRRAGKLDPDPPHNTGTEADYQWGHSQPRPSSIG